MPNGDTTSMLRNWLLTEGPGCTGLADFVRQFNHELQSHSIPVDRIFIGPLLIHPVSSGIAVSYEYGADILREKELSHDLFAKIHASNNTPMAHLVHTKQKLRARLNQSETFNMKDLLVLKSKDYTDFLAIPIIVSGTLRACLTIATKQATGFSDGTIELLNELTIAIGPILLLLTQRFEHRSILKTYLGSDAGERVWHGQIQRGDSETLRAAIYFCDLRGFTELSGQLDRKRLLDLINDVFAHLVACVAANGGQVLKFMGDGLLATFVDKQGQPLCGPALNAASDAITAIETLRALRKDEGKETPLVGIGLHVGEVLYGNIGAPGRLDFTVIGNAVNQTARIEGLCERVGRPILMSEAFATAMDFQDFPCGEYEVKGFDRPIRVYGLAKGHRPQK